MTTTDTIYTRHERALMTVGHASDVVRFSLRLALEELAESTPTPDYAGYIATIETLGADLERLQTAANAEVAELRQQIAQMDADNAALIRRNKDLADELKQARLDRQETAFHANGNGAVATIAPPDIPFWQQPQALELLDGEATDWWIGVAAGRHAWRTVPKPVQLRMVRHVLSFGPETGSMKMADFDAVKPDWMPSANSHTKTLGLSWQQLNDWSIEL